MNQFRLYCEDMESFVTDELKIETVTLEGGVKGVYNVRSVQEFIKKNRSPDNWISVREMSFGKVNRERGVFDLEDTVEFVMKGGI